MAAVSQNEFAARQGVVPQPIGEGDCRPSTGRSDSGSLPWVFDPLHIGHIRHFADARRHGDVLVVTVTPDRFVNKGPHRPVFSQDLRAEAVGSLTMVDHVAVNEYPTAVETIRHLRPNVFVKGSEFRGGRDLTGAIAEEEAAVKSIGGRLDFTDDITFSASHLVNRHLSVFPPDVVDFLTDFSQRYPTADVLLPLQNASRLKVLVVGETILDEYQYVEAIGKSSKEPTLVVKSLDSERFLGGAAAVANHVAGFAGEVTLYSWLGSQDTEEAFIREHLKANITPQFVYRGNSPTIVKRRFIERYFFTKLFEVYEINDALPSVAESHELTTGLRGSIGDYDLVIAVDFGHGMMTAEMVDLLSRDARFLAVNTQANAGKLRLSRRVGSIPARTFCRLPRTNYGSIRVIAAAISDRCCSVWPISCNARK